MVLDKKRLNNLSKTDTVLINNLCHSYGLGENRKKVLDGINMKIKKSEVVLLKGPSGCGKTTLLTLIGALRTCQDGSLKVLSEELNGASKTLGASPLRSLFNVNLPLTKNIIVAAGLLVFIDATKELPLTLILRPFNFETLATATFDLSNQAQIIESSIPSLLIIFLTMIPIIYLNHRIGEGR